MLAGFVPLFAYLATASGFGFWLDGGELAAAAVDLDISHPPGHPLAALVGRAVAYVPIGPLAFRVAVAQSLCAAGAGVLTFRAIVLTMRAQVGRAAHEFVVVTTALGASWLATLSYGFWFQAVRPEVYALEALLLAFVVERVLVLEARWPTHDLRPLYQASLGLGLALSNHHFMALLLGPALLPTLLRVHRAKGWRPLAIAGSSCAAGLAVYLYLPLRSRAHPPMNLGHPDDLQNFFWVVSARAYQRTHALEDTPFVDRFFDVVLALVESLQLPTLLVAAVGAYALLRAPGVRRIGWVWIAVAGASIVARAKLGFVRNNPDALGYLTPALAALAALAAAAVGAVHALTATVDSDPVALADPVNARPHPLALALSFGMLAAGGWQLVETAPRASLASFADTDAFDGPRHRDLPTRAVVVAYGPQTVFRHFSAQAIEVSRPDVTLVPMPFLGYPGMVEALVEREPGLGAMLRGYLVEGELRQPDVQSLASERPLLVEMDPRTPLSLVETIAPSGLYYVVEPGGTAEADVARGARVRDAILARLYDEVGVFPAVRETRDQLVWLHYMDAIFFARAGARESARRAVERGLALAPEARELLGLRAALSRGEGPVDVSPFLVGLPRP